MPLVYFFTLSRSDYASIRPVVRAALADPAIDVKLVAGGSHLLKRFGSTIDVIRKDGLPVHAIADFLRESDDSPAELALASSRAGAEFTRILTADSPDLVFVVGDRWELLPLVATAAQLRIPIVHHSGGDITQGSADNQTRFALTALAHIHLTALPEHRERLLRMGEESWRVAVTGEPALTELSSHAKSVPDVRNTLGLKPSEPFVLATFHPTSYDSLPLDAQISKFIEALSAIPESIIVTAPNPDAGSSLFRAKLHEFASANSRVKVAEALGTEVYYAAMAAALFMIGNSSSGLWEAPSFGLPVVNIGPRQQGRVHGKNVLHAPLEGRAIAAAVSQAREPSFRAALAGAENPYLRANTIPLILDALKKSYDRELLVAKRFVDPLSLDIRNQ